MTSRSSNAQLAHIGLPDGRGTLARSLTLAPIRRQTPFTLAYHELSPQAGDYSYALSCRQFEEHLQLTKLLQRYFSNPAPPLVISFDDGHISNYTLALPLLEKYGLRAIFFVIVGRIGKHKEFMTWAQLKELARLGHRVEAHSWSHNFLTECSELELHEDLMRSRSTLEDHLGKAPKALSAPHGRWNQRVLDACARNGFEQLYTSDPWAPVRSSGPTQVMDRLVIVQSMSPARLLHWVTMGSSEAALRRAQQALKKSVQRILGNKLYYGLWTRLSGWNGPEDTALAKNE